MAGRTFMAWLVVAFLCVAGGCGGNGGAGSEVKSDASDHVDAADVSDASDHVDAADVSDEADGAGFPVALGPENRGWKVVRGIVHLHSAYSHDGCGPDGYEDFGGADPACLKELRDAACANGIDFAMLTDHPGEAKDQAFEDDLLYMADQGDELILDAQARPFANRITCSDGSLADHVWIYAGTEGHKNMPIAMAAPAPEEKDLAYSTDFGDEEPLANAQAAVAKVHELGGYAFAAHTEESSISAKRMLELPLDGMEIYNIHANLMKGLDSIEVLYELDRFMGDPGKAAAADLSLLLFLAPVQGDVDKYDQVLPGLDIAIVAATDIHRNVEIPALCEGGLDDGGLCEEIAAGFPNFAQFLVTGGPVPLSDGDRMDSYGRAFRWMSNRVLVDADDPQEIRDAVGKGRGGAVFDLLGVPGGFDFVAVSGSGKVAEVGGELSFADGPVMLYGRAPTLEAWPWMEAQPIDWWAAQVVLRVIRVTASGAEVVLLVQAAGETFALPADEPAAYRVEVSVIPSHLIPLLPGVEAVGKKMYPYVYTNAIRVE